MYLFGIQGKMKNDESKKLHNMLSEKEKELIKNLVPKIIDTTLHNLLWKVEQEELIEIIVKEAEQEVN